MNGSMTLADLFVAVWPRVLAFDLSRYVIATLLMSAVVAVVSASAWAFRRIQDRLATPGDYIREIVTSLRTAVLFSFVGFSIVAAQGSGLLPTPPPFSWPRALVMLALMVVAHDACFYWTHRAMHHPRLFKAFHRPHHVSVTPTPFAAYAFAIPETLVQAAFMPLWMALVPTYPTTALIFMTVMIIRNVWGHAGVEVHPRGMADHPVFGILSTRVYHDLHYAGSFDKNFGFYFTYWDRLMGTEHPDYRRRYREITERPLAHPAPALKA